eukprot:6418288-Pyramimonas_sp.AAC.1
MLARQGPTLEGPEDVLALLPAALPRRPRDALHSPLALEAQRRRTHRPRRGGSPVVPLESR